MRKLIRQVRFSINPFLPKDKDGFNSYTSEPAGEGLSLFFELSVELTGKVEPNTGFVVNVIDVDRQVREHVVPIFASRVREYWRQGRHITFSDVAEILNSTWKQLADKFGTSRLSELSLALNPFRKIVVNREDCKMIYFSEKFEFAAMHKLWNDDFSEERNFQVFGKCANPAGHGHNYIVEVKIELPTSGNDFCIGDFERVISDELINLLDHKNLNAEVAGFDRINPTVENITTFAWEKIAGKFGLAKLHCVTVWETDKTYCSYFG